MNYIILSFFLFSISITCFLIAYIEVKNMSYGDSDTEKKCTDTHLTNLKDGNKCGVWDGRLCRKGEVSNAECIASGHVLPLIVFICSGLSFITSVIFLIIGIKHRS